MRRAFVEVNNVDCLVRIGRRFDLERSDFGCLKIVLVEFSRDGVEVRLDWESFNDESLFTIVGVMSEETQFVLRRFEQRNEFPIHLDDGKVNANAHTGELESIFRDVALL